ncbi:MAG: CVNH domain-containing protein [Nostoc sp.]|uniref:CVNH domain-containing protein n=1 Tax=Nostoc sp. TaxID=1180 RepID=UPI002FFA790E
MATTTTNLEQFYFRIITVFSLTLLTTTAASPAFARSPSTFQNSCRNTNLKSNVLSAICRKRDGGEQKTGIILRGINNRNGFLVDDGGNSPASFQASCFGAAVIGDELLANCFKINRTNAVFNKIKIQGIRNENGNLKY